MLLRPEKMLRFKIIVPSEYEYELLDSLASLGAIHLKPLSQGLRTQLPLLLQLVYENRISLDEINIRDAYNLVTRVTRKDDVLRIEMEKIYEEYSETNYYMEIVEKLLNLNLSPMIFRTKSKKFEFKWYYVDKRYLEKLVAELRRNDVSTKIMRLSNGDIILILIYSIDIGEKISNIIEKYELKDVELPDWMYTTTDFIFPSINRKTRELKRKTYEILSELANLLLSAYEYEYTSRLQLLESSLNACENLCRAIPLAEEILYNAFLIKVSRKILEERDISFLEKMNLKKKILNLYRELLEKDTVNEEFYNSIKGICKINQDICREIYNEIENIEKYEALKKVFSKYFVKIKDLQILRRKIGNIEISIFFGERGRIDYIERKMVERKAIMEKIFLEENKVALIIAHEIFYRDEIERILNKYNMKKIIIPQYAYTSIDAAIREFDREIKNRVEKIKLLSLMILIEFQLKKKKRRIIKDVEYIELSQELEILKTMKIEAKKIPPRERFEILRNVLEDSEDILKILENTYNILKNIGKEPSLHKIYVDEEHFIKVVRDFIRVSKEILPLKPFIEYSLKAQSLIYELTLFRKKRVCIADGWIPERYAGYLEKTLISNIPRIIYFKTRNIIVGEEAPTSLKHRGILKYFTPITLMRGVPSYWEIDPTRIFTILFLIMYGIMFGDIGLGLIISLFGFWLYKSRRSILGISGESLEKLGVLSLFAGISSMIFGALYGIVFLKDIMPFRFISPIHDIYTTMGLALLFGVIQLLMGMTINVINSIIEKNYFKAIFKGTGIVGIIYYITGVYLAYLIIKSNYNLGILISPPALNYTLILISMLLIILLSSLYKFYKEEEKENLIEGVIEILEMMIAYPANSLSYIRLAAFAIAHEAFGMLAEELALMINPLISYVFTNFLVLIIEGFAVGIQALRLTYYEFSTKFFRGGGEVFKPLSTSIELEMRVK